MAAQNKRKIMWGRAAVYYGDTGSTPATLVGYTTDDGVSCKFSEKKEEFRVAERDFPIVDLRTSDGFALSFGMAQLEAETLGLALGRAPAANVILMGGATPSADVNKAWKILGTNLNGDAISITIYEGSAAGDVDLKFAKKNPTDVGITINALDVDSGNAVKFEYGANATVTIATGTFARTSGTTYYKVAGEGAAADALTDITGASLVNGEQVTLQISAATMPITLTHGAGTLELDGAANWIMTSVNDWIKLQYDLPNTKWVEIERFNAAV
ncbi:MAG: hypothetical protein ABFD60_07030 [Bryobacteraceae bacterium]